MTRLSDPTPSTSPDQDRPRLTTAEFYRMMAEGKIYEGSRTYLWDGEIIEPMPENLPHINAVDNLQNLLRTRLALADWTIYLGHPVFLADGYAPQPDISVLRGPRSAYRTHRPVPADIVLLVEVADSTYYDHAGKFLRRYALEGIPQYWIVNINARRFEVYTDPLPGQEAYGTRRDYPMGAVVPLVLTVGGVDTVFEGIVVEDVLRDSLEEPAP